MSFQEARAALLPFARLLFREEDASAIKSQDTPRGKTRDYTVSNCY
jgi:hypothetical protein